MASTYRPNLPASYLFAISILFAILATTAGTAAAEPILLRFSHVVSENTPKGIGAELFKQRVEERLAGKVKVEVYPNSQKFDDDRVMTALLFGDVELAAPSLAKFRGFTKQLQVFDLPFLFDNTDAVDRFQASETGRALLNSMLQRRIKGLAYWDNGMRVMSADKPLRMPADVKGLVFRIEPSNVITAQYQTLGATTLELPFGRVFDALNLGLVDGQENAWSNIASKQFYKVQKYFTETNHSYLGYMVVTNAVFWNGLPPDIRTALEEILADVTAEVNKTARTMEQSSRETVKASGSTVLSLTPAELNAWREALKPVWQRFEDQIGKDVIEAAIAANRNSL